MAQVKLKAIVPKKYFKAKAYADALRKGAEKTAKQTHHDYDVITRTWDHKINVQTVVNESGSKFSITTGTDDDIFKFLDEGTGKYGPKHKPYEIKPKNASSLRFMNAYSPKTRIGFIGSQSGGASGDIVFSQGVLHPGIQARLFTETIRKRRQKSLEQNVAQEIAKVNREERS